MKPASQFDIPLDRVRSWYEIPLMEPEIILPDQYFGHLVNGRSLIAEHKLLAAILADAINCYLGRNDHESVMAHRWFVSPRQNFIMSYHNVCEELSINHTRLWDVIRTYRKQCVERGVKPRRLDIHAVVN
jgi:hypothetical protein